MLDPKKVLGIVRKFMWRSRFSTSIQVADVRSTRAAGGRCARRRRFAFRAILGVLALLPLAFFFFQVGVYAQVKQTKRVLILNDLGIQAGTLPVFKVSYIRKRPWMSLYVCCPALNMWW